MNKRFNIFLMTSAFIMLFCFSSIKIVQAQGEASSASVLLDINAVDTMSGLDKMMISNYSDFKGGVWEPYAPQKQWTLLKDRGTNIVYIKVKDKYENTSAPYKATIVLDDKGVLDDVKVKVIKDKAYIELPKDGTLKEMNFSQNGKWVGWEKYKTSKELTLKNGWSSIAISARDGEGFVFTKKILERSVKPSPKQTVVFIATKNDFADAFAGEVLARKLGGKVVLLGKSEKEVKSIVGYVTKNLTVKDAIYIYGLNVAVENNVEKELKAKGYKNIVRVGGADKYETAQKIAEKLNPVKGTSVVLVNGEKMPKDGQNIKKLCAEKGLPILFVKKDSLTKYTLKALKQIQPQIIYVVGDRTEISDEVLQELQKELKVKSMNIVRIKNSKEIRK